MRSTIVLLALLALGCDKQDARTPIPAATPPVARAATSDQLTGMILEKIDVAGYSYLRIDGGQGEVWAAVPTTTMVQGDLVSVVNPMAMSNFKSTSLDRTFDTIFFGTVGGSEGSTGAAMAMPPSGVPAGMGGMPPTGMPAPTSGASVPIGPVTRAEGPLGHTIAEVVKERATLKTQQVAVRGTVVKITRNVLGRNWMHIRDGSGAEATSDNDLTVTTADMAAIGDTVLIQGVVNTDKDFGAGYTYAVIVEDAKVTK